MKVTRRLIRGRAQVALRVASNGEYDGMCDPVCVEFCKLMRQLGYDTEGLASVDFLDGRPHYVAVLDGGSVGFTEADRVIVDPTVKQFEEEFEFSLPEVAIVPSTDNRWNSWYSDFTVIDDKRLREN